MRGSYRKKCHKAEYVQRRVCFVNVQVPLPKSNIYVKLCTFHENIVFCVCERKYRKAEYVQCRVCFVNVQPSSEAVRGLVQGVEPQLHPM